MALCHPWPYHSLQTILAAVLEYPKLHPKEFEGETMDRPQKIIDAKLPLSWLLGCATAIIFSMGGLFFKLDAVGAAVAKIETKTDIRDEKVSLLAQQILIQQGKLEAQALQVNRNAADITEIKRDVEDIRKNQRWAPK